MRMGQMGMGGKSILCSRACSFPLLKNLRFFFFFSDLILLASYLETQSNLPGYKRKYSCDRKHNML